MKTTSAIQFITALLVSASNCLAFSDNSIVGLHSKSNRRHFLTTAHSEVHGGDKFLSHDQLPANQKLFSMSDSSLSSAAVAGSRRTRQRHRRSAIMRYAFDADRKWTLPITFMIDSRFSGKITLF